MHDREELTGSHRGSSVLGHSCEDVFDSVDGADAAFRVSWVIAVRAVRCCTDSSQVSASSILVRSTRAHHWQLDGGRSDRVPTFFIRSWSNRIHQSAAVNCVSAGAPLPFPSTQRLTWNGIGGTATYYYLLT
jgi:hypothetical protein